MLIYPDKDILLSQSINEKLVKYLVTDTDHNFDEDIVMKNRNDCPDWKKI